MKGFPRWGHSIHVPALVKYTWTS